MALNHLNLTVPNVPQTRAFFEKYFGFRCVAEPESGLIVLVDESGFILTLNNFDKAGEVVYPGAFHVGFRRDSREQVDTIHQRLKADGFDIKAPHRGLDVLPPRAGRFSRRGFPPTGGRARG